MGSIPVSNVVQINPNVLSAGNNPLALNGVVISKNNAIPNGTVLSFASKSAVTAYFGSASNQERIADIYFKGFDNATTLPSTLFFSHYASVDHNAFIFGGSLADIDLDTLKTYTGTLIVTVAGVVKTSSSISLSAATSFSNVASIITAAFTSPAFAVTYDSQRTRFVVTSTTAGVAQTIIYATGTIAASLKFTQATGAILGQGIDAETPADAMNRVTNATQNWASFMTDYEPLIAEKKLFGAWSNGKNNRYLYICHDSDSNTVVANSSTTVGAYFIANSYDGVVCISGQPSVAAANSTTVGLMAQDVASFVMGTTASIDFSATNGRITYAFKHQAGLATNVDDEQIAANLIGNGYNFYGAYASNNSGYSWFNNGNVSGRWVWLDEYVNQIFLNSQFQLTGADFLNVVNSMPYNQDGYTQLRTVWSDPIQQGLNAGIIRQGVPLSATQTVAVNTQAGLKIDDILSTTGYYLQILAPTAQNRGLRKSPICNFWYTSGGAVQQIVLNSIDVL